MQAHDRNSDRRTGLRMHRALVAAAVVVALLGVGAGPATVEAATHSARGTGTTIVASFSFEARREDGRVSGRVTVETGALAGTLKGTVKCLAVRGKRAALAGKLDQPVQGATHFVIVVEDNGPAQEPPVDRLEGEFLDRPVGCGERLDQPLGLIASGNIRVR